MKNAKVLRISITDRCNLRCLYCMPEEGVKLAPSKELLSYEEIELIAQSAMFAGINRFRLTGGEPLVRRNMVWLVEKLAELNCADLALTTNGILLSEFAFELKSAGLKRVTISLDTLRKERFERITRQRGLEKVFLAIDSARRAGLEPVKLNTVIIRGINDDEVIDFVRFAEKEQLEIRFIELMPTTGLNWVCKELGNWRSLLLMPGAELKQKIEQGLSQVLSPQQEEGVAKIYRTSSGTRIGFITPVSEQFCDGCQRLRLTAEGKLKICLFDDQGIDLKKKLREGKVSPEKLSQIFQQVLKRKAFWKRPELAERENEMYKIGG